METIEQLLFYTGKRPIQEMLSAVDPAALSFGQFALIDNFSISRLSVTARWGCARLAAQPVSGASFRGCWTGYLGGVWTRLFAFRVSTATRVYELTSTTWTELTSASTRFSTDGFLQFAARTDVGLTLAGSSVFPRQDGVICGNGTDEPGVVGYASGYTFARVAAPGIVNNSPLCVQEVLPAGFFNVKDGTGTAYNPLASGGGVGGNLTGADSAGASTTDNEIDVTFNAAAGVGDTLEVTFGLNGEYEFVAGAIRLDDSRMFHILVEDTIADPVFNYLGIKVYNNTSGVRHTAYSSINPGSLASAAPIYTQSSTGVYLASFDLSGIDTSGMTDLRRFQLIVERPIAVNRTFTILAFMAGGQLDAANTAGVVYTLKNSRVETPLFVGEKIRHPLLSNCGGSRARVINVIQPSGTYWENVMSINDSSSTTTCDHAIIYRKDPVDEDYFASNYIQLLATPTRWVFADNNRPDEKDYARKAPSAYTVRPPKASSWCAGNNRLVAGGISGDKSRVSFSDEGFPMRFVSVPRDSDSDGNVDPDSGTSLSFPGEEVQRIVALPGAWVGVSPIAILTNKNLWRVEGIDSLSLSRATLMQPHGTMYPRSVVVHKSNLIWLDSERQPRSLDGPLGIWKIEDQIQDGDPTNAFGIVFKEAYKLAYRAPSGTVNKRVLNFEERLNGWHRHTYTNPDWAGFLIDEVSAASGTRLLGVTDTGEIFEIEQKNKLVDDQKTGASTDDITLTLTSGEIHADMWDSVFFGRCGLLCDKATGRTLTFTRSDPANASNPGVLVGAVDCETGVADRAWRYDQNATTKGPPGLIAQACQISMSGAWTPGKYIKGWFVELGPNDKKPDVAA